jgi:hypothetical protein
MAEGRIPLTNRTVQEESRTSLTRHQDLTDPLSISLPQVRFSWRDLDDLEGDETPMLWDGFLPNREIALLAGIGGYGKSSLVRQLAISIARGDKEFLTRKIHAPHKKVIYVACEDGPLKTRKILRNLGGRPVESLVFLFASQLLLDDVLVQVAEELSKGMADLIVIDSLGNLFKGEQNSNSSAQAFYSQFAWFADKALVLFLHHIRKSDHRSAPDQVNIQGAGAFVQRPRAVLMLTGNKHATERYLHVDKENDVSDTFRNDALILQFDREHKRYTSDGLTKPVRAIGGELQNEAGWDWLFLEGEEKLPTGTIIERIKLKYSIQDRAAKERLSVSGLKKIGHGWYLNPKTQSPQSAKVQVVRKVQNFDRKEAESAAGSDTK